MSRETRRALSSEMEALEGLIPEMSDDFLATQEAPLEKPGLIKYTDFPKMIEECDIEALKIVTNTALFYLSETEIRSDQYLSDKVSMDQFEISNLLFQSKSAKLTYIKLLEEIDNGNVHPRIFEVQSGLQKSMMEIMKSKTLYIQLMEKSWRDIRQELLIKNAAISEGPDDFSISGGGLKSRGTRDFLRGIQEEIKSEDAGTNITIPLDLDESITSQE